MIRRFRKLPVTIEAVYYDGTNDQEILDFCGDFVFSGKVYDKGSLFLRTLEGTMRISLYDMVVKGVDGEFYPCKNSIFWKTYSELVQYPTEPWETEITEEAPYQKPGVCF